MGKAMGWQPAIKIGNEIVDTHHTILFNLADGFKNSVMAGTSAEIIEHVLGVIRSAAFNHFEKEEELFKNEAHYLSHCQKHYKIMKSLDDFIVNYTNGWSKESDPAGFIKNLLRTHILEVDLPTFRKSSFELLPDLEMIEDDLDYGNFEDQRQFKRVHYTMVVDKPIEGYCLNIKTSKGSSVDVIDLGGGGLKIYSTTNVNVGDTLIISCRVGNIFKLKEKARVKSVRGNNYGLEFTSPDKNTVKFLTELYGAAHL